MNDAIFYFFYNLAQNPSLKGIVIFFAVNFIYVVIVLAGIFLLFHHHVLPSRNPIKEFLHKWKEFILVGAATILAWFFAKLLKVIIHTDRPFDALAQVTSLFLEDGYAFPSGHTAVAAAIAAAIFFVHKKAGYLFALFALLIGFARVASGVHFPIDILGGFALGVLAAYLAKYLLKKFI